MEYYKMLNYKSWYFNGLCNLADENEVMMVIRSRWITSS